MPKDPSCGARRKPKRGQATPTWRAVILREAESNLCFYAASIASRAGDTVIRDQTAHLIAAHPHLPPPAIPEEEYTSWALSMLGTSEIPALRQALVIRKEERNNLRGPLRAVARNLCLTKYPTAMATLRHGIARLWFAQLPDGQVYPPRDQWVASTPRIYDTWVTYLANCELADQRKSRKPIHLLDPKKIAHSIPEDLSCLVFDSSTKSSDPILAVFRKFCNLRPLLNFATGIVSRGAAVRRNVRKEDSGTIFLAGFSAGSRSHPKFGITRNFECSEGEEAEKADNETIANILAYLWSRAKGIFPTEIINDFENFYDGNNIPRFDPNWPASATKFGTLKLVLEGREYVFDNIERAPGCAVMVQRYARPVHYEHQGHKFAISWMNHRQGTHLAGGHFYLCTHGIEVKACEDTAWAWMPEMWHTTGLANFDPTFEVPALSDPFHDQQSIALVTSNRLQSVWKKYEVGQGIVGRQRVQLELEEIAARHSEGSGG
ncbi:hypothetical protein EST38_g8480 [Candolleomyces aberdarensis]|uniref:Uncharacterized protein n=1 Tax=Candolleomyces aberdarensis TaxID=2316362 RepID=A0A4Q2DF96_9AGAR|nr:hypothetical protein EST38_g8480 [Candolleomyces aberdarensis]